MIVHFKRNADKNFIQKFIIDYEAISFFNGFHIVAVTPSAIKKIDVVYESIVEQFFIFNDDIQLSSKNYLNEKRVISFDNIRFGGNCSSTIVIAGPCSVESEEQIIKTAELLCELHIKVLRAGTYKPRTSPYSFQGLGLEGLKMLSAIRDKYKLKIITEARDSSHIDEIIEYADIIQIGAKAMYDHSILRKCSKITKPVLIKRGFGSTLQEFVQAAEFILSGGNENVILCERGIRTFETKTRFTLDLCGVAFLKEYTNLPIFIDTSHAMGFSYGVPDLTRASVAMGVDGLLIETHPEPKNAKSDAQQQLNHLEFKKMFYSLAPVAKAIGRSII